MEERLLPATQFLGAAFPAGLAWERAGRRIVRQASALGVVVVVAALAWGRLPAKSGVVAEVPPPAAIAPASLAPLSERGLARPMAIPPVTIPAPIADPLPAGPQARRIADGGTGEASYYARGFEGRTTASGEIYRAASYTAAHRSLAFGTMVRVTNLRNGRSVVVRVNDRGPFHRRRIVDLSRAAAAEIGLVRRGRGPVRIDLVEP